MSNIPIGAYTYSDSYLRKLKKDELIDYYRTLEKNWFNEIESREIQIENSKKLLENEYSKAINDLESKAINDVELKIESWKKRWSKQEFELMDFAATTCEVIVRRNAEELKNIAAE